MKRSEINTAIAQAKAGELLGLSSGERVTLTKGILHAFWADSNDAIGGEVSTANDDTHGNRIFFHHRGANALFQPEHIKISQLTCKIFHLGYLLLLDAMDQPDADYGTVAARLLKKSKRLEF